MKRRVIWSDAARRDVSLILTHIGADNPYAASRVADRIKRTTSDLSDLPTGRPGCVTGTFEKLVRGLPYIVAYEIIARSGGRESVSILHVIHGARHWPAEAWPED